MKLSLPMQRALLRMEPGRTYPNAAEVPAAWHTVEALVMRELIEWDTHLWFRLTPAGVGRHNKLKEIRRDFWSHDRH